MVISSGYVDGYALHKIGVAGCEEANPLAWSSASATAQRGALDLGLLGFRARPDVPGYSRLMSAD
jgi:hypothetical protein